MSENQIPATQPEAGAAAGEFNFAKPEGENPRIKKRSLKTGKPAGLIKPNPAAIAATRELEKEAPPLSAEQAKPTSVTTEAVLSKPVARTTEAPPRTTPSPKIASTATPTPGPNSPHGTRPATLYYSSPTRKAETPSPMKTIPTASSASPASSASAATPAARVTTTTASAPRASSPNIDYRANVERQSREQKSVGSILSYVVYGLIAFFVISAALAAYGADIIFAKLHDQSTTVAELDQHYTHLTDDLNTKLTTTQDTLIAAQATITRQQDVITKQGEAINQLLTASGASDAAIKVAKAAIDQEKAARLQDAANLRARVKELEYKTSQKNF